MCGERFASQSSQTWFIKHGTRLQNQRQKRSVLNIILGSDVSQQSSKRFCGMLNELGGKCKSNALFVKASATATGGKLDIRTLSISPCALKVPVCNIWLELWASQYWLDRQPCGDVIDLEQHICAPWQVADLSVPTRTWSPVLTAPAAVSLSHSPLPSTGCQI